jgi:hypothetical protein
MTAQAVLELVESVRGAAVIAHPFKPGYQFHARELAEHPRVCALEVCNGQCLDYQNADARALAVQLKLPGTGGSDAHKLHEIGSCYTEFSVPVHSEQDLVAALLAGAMQPRRAESL